MPRCSTDLKKLYRGYLAQGARCVTLQDIRKYARQMLEGLAELHRQGFIHRDLKPDNLLVTEGGVLKIGDFGLSRIQADGPMSPMLQTQWWRAPEVFLNG